MMDFFSDMQAWLPVSFPNYTQLLYYFLSLLNIYIYSGLGLAANKRFASNLLDFDQ